MIACLHVSHIETSMNWMDEMINGGEIKKRRYYLWMNETEEEEEKKTSQRHNIHKMIEKCVSVGDLDIKVTKMIVCLACSQYVSTQMKQKKTNVLNMKSTEEEKTVVA